MTPDYPDEDARQLAKLGYAQELARALGGFSNFAISLSIICILAGGLTSFHVGYCAAGPGGVVIGWSLMTLGSLAVAATMAQIASAFPTAGGLYHWAAILGGRGWGWLTAWFNLLGLIAVLAAINVGLVRFVAIAFFPETPLTPLWQLISVSAVTLTQCLWNHLGIRLVRWLTDFSGYWILGISLLLTTCLFFASSSWDFSRFVLFTNFSGLPAGDAPVWPKSESLFCLFALGLLLPAYTITGFDASAHAAEETHHAALAVPQGIVRSVFASGAFGLVMMMAIVLAIPDVEQAAKDGESAFFNTLKTVLSKPLGLFLLGGISLAQYLCGLATVTSGSRMLFAFARDGGLPFSSFFKRVSPTFQTPGPAIWIVGLLAVGFTAYAELYSTIAAVCVIFLYISYVIPTVLGLLAIQKSWNHLGPWHVGRWFRPLAVVSLLTCIFLIVIGMQPPNEKAIPVVLGMLLVLAVIWFSSARKRFPGPPEALLNSLHEGNNT